MKTCEWRIDWRDSLAVGDPETDDEHRQFITRVNELDDAIVEADDKATVERLLKAMLAEAKSHFFHEQKLMNKWNYPRAKVHGEKHAELAARFGRVMQEVHDTDISYVWAFKGLQIQQLLVEHLVHEDLSLGDFLREQRRAPARNGEVPVKH